MDKPTCLNYPRQVKVSGYTIHTNWLKRPYVVLTLVSIAEFMAMSIWFSFSAIKPLISEQWAISNTDTGLILAAFQAGYILAVPVLGYLADVYNVRKVFALSALAAAALNLLEV